MVFIARPIGGTIRRFDEAIERPHDPRERFDGGFPVALRCEKCGKYAHGPRALIREAMREHQETACSARHTKADEPNVMRVAYPRI